MLPDNIHLSLDDWLSCDQSLCPISVHEEGVIDDAPPTALHVDFANRKIGGGVLGTGRVQVSPCVGILGTGRVQVSPCVGELGTGRVHV